LKVLARPGCTGGDRTVPEDPPSQSRPYGQYVAAVIVTVIGTVIAAVVTDFFGLAGSSSPSGQSSGDSSSSAPSESLPAEEPIFPPPTSATPQTPSPSSEHTPTESSSATDSQVLSTYNWYWMTDKGSLTDGMSRGAKSINGDLYAKTVWQSWPIRFQAQGWTLVASGDCTSLRGVAGFVDSSTTNAEAVLTIYGDGIPIHTFAYSFGETQELNVDIKNYLRVKVRFTSNGRGFDRVYPAIGDGRVRCAL
jgi:hypothetical protein